MSSRRQWIPVLAFTLVAVTGVVLFKVLSERQSKSNPNKNNSAATKKEIKERKLDEVVPVSGAEYDHSVKIIYASTTGTARQFATTLFKHMGKKCPVRIEVCDMNTYNEEQLSKEDVVIFICSTWEGGVPPKSAARFYDWLQEQAFDFRVSKDYLENVKFAVFGLGGAIYGKNYAKFGKDVDECMERLGATRLEPYCRGDDQTSLEQVFYKWNSRIVKLVQDLYGEIANEYPQSASGHKAGKKVHNKDKKNADSACCGGANKDTKDTTGEGSAGGCCSSAKNTSTTTPSANRVKFDDDDDDVELEDEDLLNDAFVDAEDAGDGLVDMEEMGNAMHAAQKEKLAQLRDQAVSAPREMVTKMQYKALTKEGYKIIGSHSAVKICRWTKHQLRGRGGCYKHSFYGITSYQCMEATPSLACANKCVFCWRHHKNPVGTEWRWKEDGPEFIVEEAIRLHVNMIHQLKGMPGVQPERFLAAHTVKHCALSLVGEPIMYPRINDMVKALHDRGISSFLVTNAQFPDRIEQLDPVTQLYVSVDAASKESLKAVDRPLFKDFWERFMSCLKAIQYKQQRTVFRLTLVKEYNMEEVDGYAQLIEEGTPDFIEIKAVTYCGKSDASNLTMQNVPWHEEVCNFGEAICRRLNERNRLSTGLTYNLATEHAHSCCILIAREDKFRIDGEWWTWIDYDAFNRLIQEYYASGKTKTFRSEDYRAKTPDWAVYHSKERGFDPVDKRWYRKSASQATSEVASVVGAGEEVDADDDGRN